MPITSAATSTAAFKTSGNSSPAPRSASYPTQRRSKASTSVPPLPRLAVACMGCVATSPPRQPYMLTSNRRIPLPFYRIYARVSATLLLVGMEGKSLKSFDDQTVRFVPILRREIVAQALKDLWQAQGLAGEPLIFPYSSQGRMQTEHHPQLLDQLVAKAKQRKRLTLGQLASWQRLDAPASAYGISAASEVV